VGFDWGAIVVTSSQEWGAQLTTHLIEAGVEAEEAHKLAGDFLAEAQDAGQDPVGLYGPAMAYASTIAHDPYCDGRDRAA